MEELVSIGMPVKNGFEGKLRNNLNLEKAIKSILNQSYKKIEIIISNDCSTDKTEEYLRTIAKTDNRIFLYNQKKELGLGANFRFVLEKSTGKYFKWNAQDDIISKDYIKNNIKFLQTNPSYIASSSKFSYENNQNKFYSYNLDENLYLRINNFFNIRHISHNLTHSLIRKKYIFKTTDFTNDYWAIDWIFDLELLIYGKFKTIKKGYAIFGMKGLSKKKNFFLENHIKKSGFIKLFHFTN